MDAQQQKLTQGFQDLLKAAAQAAVVLRGLTAAGNVMIFQIRVFAPDQPAVGAREWDESRAKKT